MTVIPFRPKEPGWEPADSFADPTKGLVSVFPDREESAQWRVEYQDEDGGCYVSIFAGPSAEQRARAYFAALKSGTHRPKLKFKLRYYRISAHIPAQP